MDQVKIGRFIANVRKEKKMTQRELADKLKVTDRAVGNWENGRRLPDYSILINLCNTLGITINELFAGQYLKEKEVSKQSETNIINIMKESNGRKKKYKVIIFVFVFFITILLILLGRVALIKYGYIMNDDLKYTQIYESGHGNIKGDVNILDYGHRHIDFDIGANKYGFAVFKNPKKAFKRLKKDYADGIKLIQKEFNLPPLNNFTFRYYSTYGWQVTTGTEEEKEQARFVGRALGIYGDSFNAVPPR